MQYTKLVFTGFAILTLAGCSLKSYKVLVELTPEKAKEIQANVETLKKKVEDFVPSKEAIIPWEAIIDLAQSYEELGELGKAVKVYEDAVKGGKPSKAILNNLGRLYDQTEQYDKAVTIYQRISDTYIDHSYLYDITWSYIHAGDRKNGEKYFNAWQLEFRKTDEQVQQAIKKLREDEKAKAGQ